MLLMRLYYKILIKYHKIKPNSLPEKIIKKNKIKMFIFKIKPFNLL